MRAAFALRALLMASALGAAAPVCSQITTTILPEQPTAGEDLLVSTVACTGGSPSSLLGVEARIEGTTITLIATVRDFGFAVPSCVSIIAVVPAVPAGTYEVQVRIRSSLDAAPGNPDPKGTVTVRPGAAATPQFTGLNGNWFQPAQAGWGANIVQGASGALLAAWLDYRVVNPQSIGAADPQFGQWNVLSYGKWITPTTFRGVLYRTRGSPPNMPWSPADARVDVAGYLSLTFTSPTEAQFDGSLVIPASAVIRKTASIRRFQF